MQDFELGGGEHSGSRMIVARESMLTLHISVCAY